MRASYLVKAVIEQLELFRNQTADQSAKHTLFFFFSVTSPFVPLDIEGVILEKKPLRTLKLPIFTSRPCKQAGPLIHPLLLHQHQQYPAANHPYPAHHNDHVPLDQSPSISVSYTRPPMTRHLEMCSRNHTRLIPGLHLLVKLYINGRDMMS